MSWIKTITGEAFDYANPTADMIDINVICHSLFREGRFCNQLTTEWSVGQHVLFVHKLVELHKGTFEEKRDALHHDDPEAYMKDLPTPLKSLLGDYKIIYAKVARAVENKLNVQIEPTSSFVKRFDTLAMLIEDHLFSQIGVTWHKFTKKDYKLLDEKFNHEVSEYIGFLLSNFISDLEKEYLMLSEKYKMEKVS